MKHCHYEAHKEAHEKYIGYLTPAAAIDDRIEKWSDEKKKFYKIRLTYSLFQDVSSFFCIKGQHSVDTMKAKSLATEGTSQNC